VFHLLGDADTCARSAVAAARAWIIEPTVANTDAANAAANALPARIITQTASWQAKANASAVNAAWYAARTVFDLVVLPVDHAHAAERCASVALKAECSARVRGATTTIL